jgi:polysaccharide export outer membrane protein
MKKFSITCLLAAVLTCILCACGGSRAVNTQQTEAPKANDSRADKLNAMILSAAMTGKVDANADYVIGPEDLLDIEVFQAEELKRTVRVSSQGYIGLPLVGQVKAKGLTPAQLEQEIVRGYAKFVQEPLVSVYVREYKAQKIAVMGSVRAPQVYAVTGQRYLLDMITMAGGLAGEAGNICYILRPLNTEKGEVSKTETLVVDLSELLEKGNMALNLPVFGGDVVNVPKGGVVFVDGAVERPGVYQMSAKTTLLQAIIMAGGTRFEALKSEVIVYRDKGDGARESISVDYDAIRNNEKDDMLLKQNDLVVVPSSGIKSFLRFFSGTLGAASGVGSIGVVPH